MSRRGQPQLRRSFFIHVCEIRVDEPVSKVPPYAPAIVRWWASLERYRTIQRNHFTSQFFRSSKSFRKEKDRHVKNPNYTFTIHPFSTMALVESVIMTIVWTLYLTIGPLRNYYFYLNYVSDFARDTHFVFLTIKIARGFHFVDIIFRMFLGYVVEKTQEVVLDRKRIFWHYLKTYLVFDATVLVLGLLPKAVLKGDSHTGRLILYQSNFLMIVRYSSLMKNLDIYLKCFKFSKNLRTNFGLIVTACLLLHWWSCILRLITVVYIEFSWFDHLERTWYYAYKQRTSGMDFHDFANMSMFGDTQVIYPHYAAQVSSHFFGASAGSYQTEDPYEMFVFSMITMIGMSFYVYATAIILEMFGIVNISETMYENLIYQATEYMTIKKYPKSIKKRVLNYYNYKFNKKFFSEMKILDGLSEHLRMEVVLYSCRNLIEQMNIFRGLSKATVGSILALLKPEIFLKNDVIMTVGDDERIIFFILYGTCVVELMSGVELLHREDGQIFGNPDASLIGHFTTAFIYKIRAIEPCEIFTLSNEDAMYCCGQHSEFADRLRSLTKERERHFNEVYSRVVQSTTSIDSGEVVSELRKKRILHRGRERILYF